MKQQSLNATLRVMLLPLLALFFTFLAACGEDNGQAVLGESSNESASWRITPTDRIYTLKDFTNIGFKKSKTYDVVDLPQAESAYFGFWGLDPYNRYDYEIRFYRSHTDAVQFGQELAVERSGPDAKVTKETATWQVGVKDARGCIGIVGQSAHAATCTVPKYYDYTIIGNMILFCPGSSIDVARENCDNLTEQMS